MPVKFPCSVCGKTCKNNQKCIACDMCNSWLHFKCIDMCISTFEKLASSLEPYDCQGCLQQHLPFSYILNSHSDIFNLEHASESQASLPSSPAFLSLFLPQHLFWSRLSSPVPLPLTNTWLL